MFARVVNKPGEKSNTGLSTGLTNNHSLGEHISWFQSSCKDAARQMSVFAKMTNEENRRSYLEDVTSALSRFMNVLNPKVASGFTGFYSGANSKSNDTSREMSGTSPNH